MCKKRYIIFIQSRDHENIVHTKLNATFCIGFAKAKAPRSIIRYCSLLRKFRIKYSKLIPRKQKYSNLSPILFWGFRLKGDWTPLITARWFHDEIFGYMLYNVPVIPLRLFRYWDKNIREDFAGFLNCNGNRPNQIVRIKPPATTRAQLNKTSDCVIHLIKEIGNIGKYKIEQENYVLYDNSNMILTTFFSELNKKCRYMD